MTDQAVHSAVSASAARLSWQAILAPLCTIAIAASLLGVAEYAARNQLVSPIILPAPTSVWKVLVEGMASGYFVDHLISTAGSLALGFTLGFLLAVSVAAILSSSPFIEKVFTPFIIAFQSMPKVAIAPLIVLWLGFGEASKIAIVVIVCFFPIMVNTMQGLQMRDRDHYELFMSLGASRSQLFFHMRLPHAVPYIFAGIHIGVIFSLIGAVVAEFVGGSAGVGFAMLQAKAQFDVPAVYACLLLLMALGLILHFIMSFAERRVSFWIHDMSRAAV